jgi:hypothetical protein
MQRVGLAPGTGITGSHQSILEALMDTGGMTVRVMMRSAWSTGEDYGKSGRAQPLTRCSYVPSTARYSWDTDWIVSPGCPGHRPKGGHRRAGTRRAQPPIAIEGSCTSSSCAQTQWRFRVKALNTISALGPVWPSLPAQFQATHGFGLFVISQHTSEPASIISLCL